MGNAALTMVYGSLTYIVSSTRSMMVVVAAREGRTPPSSRRVQKLLSQQPLLQAAMLHPYKPHSCTVQLLCDTPEKTC